MDDVGGLIAHKDMPFETIEKIVVNYLKRRIAIKSIEISGEEGWDKSPYALRRNPTFKKSYVGKSIIISYKPRKPPEGTDEWDIYISIDKIRDLTFTNYGLRQYFNLETEASQLNSGEELILHDLIKKLCEVGQPIIASAGFWSLWEPLDRIYERIFKREIPLGEGLKDEIVPFFDWFAFLSDEYLSKYKIDVSEIKKTGNTNIKRLKNGILIEFSNRNTLKAFDKYMMSRMRGIQDLEFK